MSEIRVDKITNEAGSFTQFASAFSKADRDSVAWTKTGTGSAETATTPDELKAATPAALQEIQ